VSDLSADFITPYEVYFNLILHLLLESKEIRMAEMNEYIEKQINGLQNPKISTRYDACESLRVATTIPPEAIKALQNAINDPNAEVADAANRALSIHLSSETTQKKQDVNMNDGNKPEIMVYLIMLGIPTLIFVPFIYITNDTGNSQCTGILSILYVVVCIVILASIESGKNKAEVLKHSRNELLQFREQYQVIRGATVIPENAKEITYFKASGQSPIRLANSKNNVFIWKLVDNICFFPSEPDTVKSIKLDDVKIFTIPISQIEYFAKRGEIFRENKISGGGGGGSSIGGAVAGQLIAGGVGAVIGSRKKINEIKSELITHDTRETFLNYFDDNKKRHSLFFDVYAYQIFNDLIPEKEYNILSAIKSSDIIKNQINTGNKTSVTDQLRELAKLRDDGIITDDEFNEKKKQLLDKIT